LSARVTDAEASDFPHARQLVRSDNRTTRKKDGEVQSATRHFVASLTPEQANPERLTGIVRAHWMSESRHWQRDACWNEDACRLRSANAACALALLRTTLQGLLHRCGRPSLPAVFEDVSAHLPLGLQWLNQRRFQR
jgi:predicted transposase YbfD/YdcC